jgi:hypothetical protein
LSRERVVCRDRAAPSDDQGPVAARFSGHV